MCTDSYTNNSSIHPQNELFTSNDYVSVVTAVLYSRNISGKLELYTISQSSLNS